MLHELPVSFKVCIIALYILRNLGHDLARVKDVILVPNSMQLIHATFKDSSLSLDLSLLITHGFSH